MFGQPLMADESQIRLPTAFVRPRKAVREDAEDSNAHDDPQSVHFEVPFFFIVATVRVVDPQRRACAKRHSRTPVYLLLWPACQHEMVIELDSTKTGNANCTIVSAFKR